MAEWRFINQALAPAVANSHLTLPLPTFYTSDVIGLNAVAYSTADELFVAVGLNGSARTSPDGLTWTPQRTATPNGLYGVVHSPSDGLFVAVGINCTIITIPDGFNWTYWKIGRC